MTVQNIALIAYLASLVFVYRMFALAREKYDSIPGRMPVHFNFRGEPNQWWRKSPFSVYLLPAVALLILGSFFASFWWLPRGREAPDDLLLVSAAGSFLTIYFMYRVNEAMLRCALGELDRLAPRLILPPLLAMLACWALLGVLPFISSTPVVEKAILCEKIENGKPVNEMDSFTLADERAALHVTLRDVRGRHEISMNWIDPDGRIYYRHNYPSRARWAKSLPYWSWMNIASSREKVPPGRWKVEFTIDRETMYEKEFSINE
ncbi:MAG: DUF1648 domain-containing protein [bacterium]